MIYEDFLASSTGYKPITLYWNRFSIAERFGKEEIKTVYKKVFKEAKKDYKLLTELVMVLSHKSLQHNELNNSDLLELYKKLHDEVDNYANSNLLGKELNYYIKLTD